MLTTQFDIPSLGRAYQLPNFRIQKGQGTKGIVYFSGNGLYFPNDEVTLSQVVLQSDRYEWQRFCVPVERTAKTVFVRDVKKTWYIDGINPDIGTIDKLAAFLKQEMAGIDHIVCVGNSAGGFAAIVLGLLIGAKQIFAISPQVTLTDEIVNNPENPLLKRYANNVDYAKWYDPASLLAQAPVDCAINLLYAADCALDLRHVELAKRYPSVRTIAFQSSSHGSCADNAIYPHLLDCPQDLLDSVYSRQGPRPWGMEQFNTAIAGAIGIHQARQEAATKAALNFDNLLSAYLPRQGIIFNIQDDSQDLLPTFLRIAPSATYHQFIGNASVFAKTLQLIAANALRNVVPHAYAPWRDKGFIDQYCVQHGIASIGFLCLSIKQNWLAALQSCERMLKECRVDMLYFDHEPECSTEPTPLRPLFQWLEKFGYDFYQLTEQGLAYTPDYHIALENSASHFFVAHSRFRSLLNRIPPAMIDIAKQYQTHGIQPRGVIHVGAHKGEEVEGYLQMGFNKILLIEANPALVQILQTKFGSEARVHIVHCAATAQSGFIDLHITNSGAQSSSILPMGLHQQIYPEIQVEGSVRVPADTIDNILASLGHTPGDYNLMNLDIQGAELLALQGAKQTLPFLDSINTEINFAELYLGCASFFDLEKYLEDQGFRRTAVTTPYHPSWGDAFYVRRPTITMRNFGRNGRFANQLFQYAFMNCYASTHDAIIELPAWPEGEFLFDIHTRPIHKEYPLLTESMERLPGVQHLFDFSDPALLNHDLSGFFQFHSSCYKAFQETIRSQFQFRPALSTALRSALSRVVPAHATLVALHLRRGDYGVGYFFKAPTSWYLTWLRQIWPTLANPVLYIASDEIESVLSDFGDFQPLHAQALQNALPSAIPDHVLDFYTLSTAQLVATSNSSFSFLAAMLNQNSHLFMRPHWREQQLVGFDPWNAEPLLYDIPTIGT